MLDWVAPGKPTSVDLGGSIRYIYINEQFKPSFKPVSILVHEEKRKIDFQDGHHGGHLGFLIRMILASFDLQVTPMLPTKFQVNQPFGSGEKAKTRFSRLPP